MTVKGVTYWLIECDTEGCAGTTGDLCEYSAWADEDSAIEAWTDAYGLILRDGTAVCPSHVCDYRLCETCDEWQAPGADDGPVCAECKAVQS